MTVVGMEIESFILKKYILSTYNVFVSCSVVSDSLRPQGL